MLFCTTTWKILVAPYLPEGEEDEGLDVEEFEYRVVRPQQVLGGKVEDDQGVQGQRDARIVDDSHVQVALREVQEPLLGTIN